jgi:hypothetical protein
MNARSSWLPIGGLALVSLLSSLLYVACGGDEEAAPTTVAEPALPPPPAPPTKARPAWDEPNFELVGTAAGPFTAGTPGAFEVRLTPRGEYHVNREYPWTVTITAPEGVTVPQTTLESGSAAEMTDTIARFSVPFTPTTPGTHHLVAAVDFGICTEEGCQFELRNVAVDVTVN